MLMCCYGATQKYFASISHTIVAPCEKVQGRWYTIFTHNINLHISWMSGYGGGDRRRHDPEVLAWMGTVLDRDLLLRALLACRHDSEPPRARHAQRRDRSAAARGLSDTKSHHHVRLSRVSLLSLLVWVFFVTCTNIWEGLFNMVVKLSHASLKTWVTSNCWLKDNLYIW